MAGRNDHVIERAEIEGLWGSCGTIAEVAARLGVNPYTLRNRAVRMRADGVPLRTIPLGMPSERSHSPHEAGVDPDELRVLVEAFRSRA